MSIMVDYVLAKECKNPDAWYMCHKCGECGRKFEDGIMVDDGGTHPHEDEEMSELKPCPFCGKESTMRAYPIPTTNTYMCAVSCKDCRVQMSITFEDSVSLDKAADILKSMWNSRAEMPIEPPKEEV